MRDLCDAFEDPSFPPTYDHILLKDDDLKMIPPIIFVKMSEHKKMRELRKNSNQDLF